MTLIKRGRKYVMMIGVCLAAALCGLAVAPRIRELRMRQVRLHGLAKLRSGDVAGAVAILEPWRDAAGERSGDERKPRDAELLYWLGVCLEKQGLALRAKEAFARGLGETDDEGGYVTRNAAKLADLEIDQGDWSAAEKLLRDRLVHARGSVRDEFRAKLVRLYRAQARFDEARLVLLEGLCDNSIADPVAAIRNLWFLQRGGAPIEAIAKGIRATGRTATDSDQAVARARLALLSGDAQSAVRELERAPRSEGKIRARLDAAVIAGDPGGVIEQAGGHGYRPGDEAKVAATVAWLAQTLGSVGAVVEPWLNDFPDQPELLETLAGLLERQNDPAAAGLRERKHKIDAAVDRYGARIVAGAGLDQWREQLALAQLAQSAGRLQEAGAWAQLVLQQSPGNPEAKAIFSAATTQREKLAKNDPWKRLANAFQTSVPSASPTPGPEAGAVHFNDVASHSGIMFTYHNGASGKMFMPETLGGGVAWLDFDGDGWIDLYATQGGDPSARGPNAFERDRLFRNRGDGTFEDATERSKLAGMPRGFGQGVAAADYDNDGDTDLFVARLGSYLLCRNLGDGTFEDATASVGLAGDREWPTSAAWGDFDGDGDLDLYVCHYLDWAPDRPVDCRRGDGKPVYCAPRNYRALPDHLFRNDNGKFVDVTKEAGIVDTDGRGLGVLAADLDDDGLLDLFVANDGSANFFFRNLGGMKFTEVAALRGVSANAEGGYQAGMGAARGDLDGDGRLDLLVTNFFSEGTTFFQNLGGGHFADRSAAIGLPGHTKSLLGFGVVIADFNNDGRPDILSVNGHVSDFGDIPYRMPMQLLAGAGQGALRDITRSAGEALTTPRLGRALALGDFDNDGRPDAAVSSLNAPLALLRNTSQGGGSRLTLKLVGTRSNRDAIGARVRVVQGDRSRVFERYGGGSFQSSEDLRMHIGLGANAKIDRIEIAWPSGAKETFHNVQAGRSYQVIEGAGKLVPEVGVNNKPR